MPRTPRPPFLPRRAQLLLLVAALVSAALVPTPPALAGDRGTTRTASAAESPPLELILPPDLDGARAGDLAAVLTRAYRVAAASLGREAAVPIRVLALPRRDAYRTALRREGVGEAEAALLAAGSMGATTLTGRTVLLNLEAISLPPSRPPRRPGASPGPGEVAAHEFTHAILRTNGITFLPAWVEEGIAHLIQRRYPPPRSREPETDGAGAQPRGDRADDPLTPDLAARARLTAALLAGDLPPLEGTSSPRQPFRTTLANGLGIQDYYRLAVQALVDEFGWESLLAYAEAGRTLGHAAAFRAAFGVEPAAWERRWREHLLAEAARPKALRLCFRLTAPGGGVVRVTGLDGNALPPAATLPPGRHCLLLHPDGRWEAEGATPRTTAAARSARDAPPVAVPAAVSSRAAARTVTLVVAVEPSGGEAASFPWARFVFRREAGVTYFVGTAVPAPVTGRATPAGAPAPDPRAPAAGTILLLDHPAGFGVSLERP